MENGKWKMESERSFRVNAQFLPILYTFHFPFSIKRAALFLLLLVTLPSKAQDLPAPPNPPRLVNDLAGVLSAGEAQTLERKLLAYNDSTSTQVAIVLVKTLDDNEVADYAVRLAEKWGIGQKKLNNGVLLLASIGDRAITIQTGYGVEARVTDYVTQEIIQQNIKPNFRNQAYYQGLDEATTRIFQALTGEFKGEARKAVDGGSRKGKSDKTPWSTIIFIGVLMLFLFRLFGGRRGGQTLGSGQSGGCGSGCLPLFLLSSLGGGGRSSWGGGGGMFSGGGGGFGGGGGGGFGGFGGGSFGGGGSSGNW